MDRYVSPAVASVIWLCIDECNTDRWCGRIYTRLNKEFIRFRNMNEMLNIFEIFWDIIGFPQKAVVGRTFKKQKEDSLLRELKEMIRVQYPENGMKDKIRMELSEEDMEKKTGDKGTFVVKIRYRQNSTWQGHVTWVEENKTVPFRSALELLKLLDSAQGEFPEDWTGEE